MRRATMTSVATGVRLCRMPMDELTALFRGLPSVGRLDVTDPSVWDAEAPGVVSRWMTWYALLPGATCTGAPGTYHPYALEVKITIIDSDAVERRIVLERCRGDASTHAIIVEELQEALERRAVAKEGGAAESGEGAAAAV